jgi:hypothetical protein
LYPVPHNPQGYKVQNDESNQLGRSLADARDALKSFDEQLAEPGKGVRIDTNLFRRAAETEARGSSVIRRQPAFISESIEVEVEHQDKFITSGYNPNCVMILLDHVRLDPPQYEARDGDSIKIVDKDIVEKLVRGSKVEVAHIPASDISDVINEDLSSLGDTLADMLLDRLGLPTADTGYPAMNRLSRFRQGEQVPGPGFAIASDKPGNIPGYEHNPMAQAEYFTGVNSQADLEPIVPGHLGDRLLANAWPIPLPVGLLPRTAVYSVDGAGTEGVHSEYAVFGISTPSESASFENVRELSNIQLQEGPIDPTTGPNGVRVDDLLAICADHLNSLVEAKQATQSHVDAHKSIIKALHHLHGLTVLQHVKPTDNNSPGE